MTQYRQETNQRPPNIPQEQWRNNIVGPAFPAPAGVSHITEQGMTLRDYFAAKAMQAEFESGIHLDHINYCAERAYKIADAMLKARQA